MNSVPHDSPWPFIIPLLVVLALPSLIPTDSRSRKAAADITADGKATADGQNSPSPPSDRQWLVVLVAAQTIVGAALLLFWMPEYLRHFPLKMTPVGILIGVIGVWLWVGLCEWQIEKRVADQIGLGFLLPARMGVNPFAEFASVSWFSAFLFFRFSVLTIVIPMAEELLLRGWLIRWVHGGDDWEYVPLKEIGWYGLWTVLTYAVLTHPQEAVAAVVWFGLVHAMMKWTGRFWDCVLAHAVTNFLLGVYVMGTETWRLW